MGDGTRDHWGTAWPGPHSLSSLFLPHLPTGGRCSRGDGVVFQGFPSPWLCPGSAVAERGGSEGVGSVKNLFPSLKPNGEGQGGSGGSLQEGGWAVPSQQREAVGLGALSAGQSQVPCVLRCMKVGGIWGRWGLRYSVSGGHILSP